MSVLSVLSNHAVLFFFLINRLCKVVECDYSKAIEHYTPVVPFAVVQGGSINLRVRG